MIAILGVNLSLEDALKLVDRYGVTVVILVVIFFAVAIIAALAYREWLFWRPRIQGWINDWRVSREKTEETHRMVATTSLDLQRSNSITMQGYGVTLNAVYEKVVADKGCVLSMDDPEKLKELRDQLRAQRKLTESRQLSSPSQPPEGGTTSKS